MLFIVERAPHNILTSSPDLRSFDSALGGEMVGKPPKKRVNVCQRSARSGVVLCRMLDRGYGVGVVYLPCTAVHGALKRNVSHAHPPDRHCPDR